MNTTPSSPNWKQLRKLSKLPVPPPSKAPRGLALVHPQRAAEIAAMGGNAVFEKYGQGHMQKIGERGGRGGRGDNKRR